MMSAMSKYALELYQGLEEGFTWFDLRHLPHDDVPKFPQRTIDIAPTPSYYD